MSGKADLARAGTMQMTSKEGKSYLDRNVTEWKKDYLMDHFDDGAKSSPSKAKLSKHTTMKGTAKEAEAILGDGKPDADALTRSQQKQIAEITTVKPKKARMSKDSTMVNTAKEAKGILGKEKLGDTRQETKKRKPSLKRAGTVAKAKQDAEAVYGKLDLSGGRQLRKRPAAATPKPAVKRAGTMQKTAKEGKAYLKRSKKSK